MNAIKLIILLNAVNVNCCFTLPLLPDDDYLIFYMEMAASKKSLKLMRKSFHGDDCGQWHDIIIQEKVILSAFKLTFEKLIPVGSYTWDEKLIMGGKQHLEKNFTLFMNKFNIKNHFPYGCDRFFLAGNCVNILAGCNNKWKWCGNFHGEVVWKT